LNNESSIQHGLYTYLAEKTVINEFNHFKQYTMNQIEPGKIYLNTISGIWKNHYPDIEMAHFQPLCFTDLPENGLVIIGLNPSYRPDAPKVNADGEIHPIEFRISEIKDQKKWDGYHKGLKTITEQIEHFSKIKDLPWGHVDLFCFRETSSRVVKNRIYKDWNFFWAQMEAAKIYIDAMSPKVILTNNAFTSDLILDHWLGGAEKAIFDDEIGTFKYNETTPIFFSGMLSGQSSLDKGNRKRLAWQIGRYLSWR
jgi:hypothetical protein